MATRGKTEIERINERGLENGWHAQRLKERAGTRATTMSSLWLDDTKNSVACSVPAKAIELKGSRLTYRFLDGSTVTRTYQAHAAR
jgi:hypothetical protein